MTERSDFQINRFSAQALYGVKVLSSYSQMSGQYNDCAARANPRTPSVLHTGNLSHQ